jgi:hypothetical protein
MAENRDAGSLRDIQKLGVVIESLPPGLVEREFYQRRLRTQVQERLSQAGIEVLPEQDAISNGFPYLYVNVNIIKTDVGLYVFATRVCLKQTMLLPREPLGNRRSGYGRGEQPLRDAGKHPTASGPILSGPSG